MAVSFVLLILAVIAKGDECLIDNSHPVSIGDILANLISYSDSYWDTHNFYMQWVDEHNANSTAYNTNCNSMRTLLKTFVANALYGLYFKDLTQIIWFYDNDNIENTVNDDIKELKLLINDFIITDSEHWRFYINDWNILGLNESPKQFSDLLIYLFSDYMVKTRKAVYETIRIDTRINGEHIPQHRYVIIGLLENMANYIFSRITVSTSIYKAQCNDEINLQYIDLHHLEGEDIHVDVSMDFEPIRINSIATVNLLTNEGKRFIHTMSSMLNAYYNSSIHPSLSFSLWHIQNN